MKNFSQSDLEELVSAGVINGESAKSIAAYFAERNSTPNNRLTIAFGILGSLLVGSGIILVLAHNWDQLWRPTKTVIAFLPLLLPQLLIWFTLIKKSDSTTWRESSSVLLFFGIGASISLISQIYHIPGEIDSFLLTWMLLGLPLVYLLASSSVSLLYIIGITIYTMSASDNDFILQNTLIYLLLLAASIPHYLNCIRNKPGSYFIYFHNWLYALSSIFVLGFFSSGNDSGLALNYLSLFAILVAIGSLKFATANSFWTNAYSLIGSLGFVIILLIFSFDFLWENVHGRYDEFDASNSSTTAIVGAALIFCLVFLIGNNIRINGFAKTRSETLVYLLFLPVYFLGMSSPGLSQIITNLLILALGVSIAYRSAKQQHLGLMNYGLLITLVLAICRFFDDELSFVLRGTLFVAVGVGFFVSNYLMIRKKKVL